MEEDKAESGLNQHRNGRRFDLAFTALLALTGVHSAYATPKHFDLPAGDARVMLNQFSQQADVQLLFDFSQLTGKNTNEVSGDFETVDALKALLRGLPVDWAFVNERTLALTVMPAGKRPAPASRPRHWWQRLAAKPSRPPPDNGLEQVLVAGSNSLYQAPPVGASLIRLDRLDIEHSGLATAQDFIHTLPQVFGGGPSEDTALNGREAPTNSSKGSGINLRGLDAGATLVLIDGQRTAPSGTAGLFADISGIPLSAIDHIDVLPDGASAQYGADAIGGVVNFVLRSQFTGSETHFRDGDFSGHPLGGRQVSQLFGGRFGSSTAMVGFEWYDRGALASRDRKQATNNLVAFGGANFEVPYGSPGTIVVGQQTWAIARGGSPASSALVAGTQNLYDQWVGADVLPDQQRWSAFGTLRSEISEGVELFADSLLTRRRMSEVPQAGYPLAMTLSASSPFYFNPKGGTSPVTVLSGSQAYFGTPYTDDSVDTGNVGAGMTWRLGNSWSLNGHVGYTFENEHVAARGLFDSAALAAALRDPNPATALDPYVDGSSNSPVTLGRIARAGFFSSRSGVKIAGMNAGGSLFAAPGGNASLTVGVEYRDQTFDTTSWTAVTSQYPVSAPVAVALRADLSRTLRGTFAELRVPLIGPENAHRFLRAVEISAGGRVENYSDVGQAAVPKAGFLWSPTADFSVLGTWTRAFRPPVLSDLATNGSRSQVITLRDASSASGATTVLLATGNNPNLQVERARTWTLGARFTPAVVPGLSVAATYFNTYYSNRIEAVAIEPDLLNHPELAWLVSRSFTARQLSEICSQTVFAGSGSCLNGQIGAIVDNRLHNAEHLQTRGIDLIGKYALASSPGRFDLALNGTYLLGYSEQKTPGTSPLQLLNTQYHPINLRLRSSLSWQRAGFGASAYVNFDNGYRDTASVPNRSVRSFTTVDLQLRYRIEADRPGLLSNTELAVTGQNIFNSAPPFLNNALGVGYDQENADLTGRILSVDIRKHW